MALNCLKHMRLFNNVNKIIFGQVHKFDRKAIQKYKQLSTCVQRMCSESDKLNNSHAENNYNDKEENLEKNILKAALTFVHVHGWNEKAISEGAATLGYSEMIHGMFPNGGIDLVNFYYEHCNENLEQRLTEMVKDNENKPDSERSLSEFLKSALEVRLRMNIEYIDSISAALAIHFSPQNLPVALHNVGTLIDHVWYHAGDRSVDFNWYQKRFALAAVYKSTELCMLQDKSADFQDTWKFLDRRLKELKNIAYCLRQTESTAKDIGDLGKAALLTTLNIIGLNSKSR